MGTLMAALVKYADSESTKDPESEEKSGKGKKSGGNIGQQHNLANQGGNGKRKADNSLDFVANTNTQNNVSVVRESRLLGLEGQVSILSSF